MNDYNFSGKEKFMHSGDSTTMTLDGKIKVSGLLTVAFAILALLAGVASILVSNRVTTQAKMQSEQLKQSRQAAQTIAGNMENAEKNASAELERLKKQLRAAAKESAGFRKKLAETQNKLEEIEKKLIHLESLGRQTTENTIHDMDGADEHRMSTSESVEKITDPDQQLKKADPDLE